ncbi:O-antigen ligase family protein [Ferrimonas balearica]|uniref:O-antigen ligase family protein n=1 Tax=Ferrimonas balearica TaxID=44012 RepID=UPI001C992F92|nr:O-antigen ligase family protein [Ferrimonas balearica]MBY5923585.1 O-antigen ligase family protein [Ferrimonas balearica]MBY5997348.1 O-antigen ligase family protein [Ferrimonas balearica]
MNNTMTLARAYPQTLTGLGLFLLFWTLAVIMVKLEMGLPARVWVLLLGLGWFALMFRVPWRTLLNDNAHLNALAAIMLVGVLTTLLNSLDWSNAILMAVKWALQPALAFLFTLLVCHLYGTRPVILIFLAVVALTSVIAVLQGLEFQPAWDLKYRFEQWQGLDRAQIFAIEQESGGDAYHDLYRSRGLSYSPIHLGYQITLVAGLLYYAAIRAPQLNPLSPFWTWSLLLLLLAAAIFSGTRSTIGGLVLLLPLHFLFCHSRRGLAVLLALLFALMLPLLFMLASELLDLRIFSTSDSSMHSRVPLTLLGLQLFWDNPLGHGWLIEASDLADQYWHRLYQIDNAEVVVYRGIHNHAVKMLFVYGVFGAGILVHYLIKLKQQFGVAILVALAPYGFHALFHNDGIFLGGNYIWVWLGIMHCYWMERGQDDSTA